MDRDRRQLVARGLCAGAAAALGARTGLAQADEGALDIVRAARAQIGVTVLYDPAYERISYPGGDVPMRKGVCTDVVIRALRQARRFDLQSQVHEDLRGHQRAYPRRWGAQVIKPDPNIDHRRVPNLMTFFARRGLALPLSNDVARYQPGDIVTWSLGHYRIPKNLGKPG